MTMRLTGCCFVLFFWFLNKQVTTKDDDVVMGVKRGSKFDDISFCVVCCFICLYEVTETRTRDMWLPANKHTVS